MPAFWSVILAQAGIQSTDVGELIRLGILTAYSIGHPRFVDSLKDGYRL